MKQRISFLFLIIFIFLSGCNIKEQKQEKKEISILYSSKTDFQNDFGFIENKFKNININIIEFSPQLGRGMWNGMEFSTADGGNWDSTTFINLVKQQHPDIIFFPQSIYWDLVNESILSDLNTYKIEETLDGINQNILESLKKLGDGKLYALSDSVSSQVLFYNKDLFHQLKIPEPVDQMSWEQLLQLGEIISSHGNLNNLHLLNYDPAELLLTMGKTDNLKWYDSVNQTLLFDSAAWKAHIENLLSFYKSKASNDTPEDPAQLFLEGKLVMTLNNYSFAKKINKNHEKIINWGVVTEPINLNEPNISKTMNFQYLNGINAQTLNFEDSLEIWKYLNSHEAAQLKSNIQLFPFTISARDVIILDDDNHNLQSFYKLEPKITKEENKLTNTARKAALVQINNILNKAINDSLPIEKTISMLQEDVAHAIQINKE